MSVTPESSVVGIQPADAAQASMIDQVVAAIEPVTRFDRSSLVVHPGRVFEIDALATACATVRFDTVSREHPGEAPREAKRFGSHSDMEDASEFALETAHAQLRERLTEWLRSIREERPPSPAECYHGPTVFAHTFQCAECAGKGRTTCSACSGGGRIRCHYCGGAGSVTCNNCHGGYVACLTCGGRGGALVGDSSGGNKRWYGCSGCSSTGQVGCTRCGRSARVTCSVCTGGLVTCRTCGGSGISECGGCKGTGKRHVIETLRCHVHYEFSVAVQSDDPDVVGRLSVKKLEALRACTQIEELSPRLNDDTVERRMAVRARFAELFVGNGDASVRMLGLGPSGVIDNFKNIAAVLLDGDLRALRAATRSQSWLALAASPALVSALDVFARSEANLRSAHPSSRSHRSKAAATGDVVNDDYISDAATAMREALRKGFAVPFLLPVLLVSPLGPLLIFAIATLGLTIGLWTTLASALGLSVTALIAAEWLTARRLRSPFTAGTWSRLEPPLRWLRRAARALGATATLGLFALVIAQAPSDVVPRTSLLPVKKAPPRPAPTADPLADQAILAAAMRSMFGIPVSNASHASVVAAIKTAGGVIVSDRLIDRHGTRILVASGAAAFNIPGLREVRCVFNNEVLGAVSLTRAVSGASRTAFEDRFTKLKGQFETAERDQHGATLRGRGLTLRMYESNGQLVEMYQTARRPWMTY